MKKGILIIIFLMVNFALTEAQNFHSIDQTTYQLYQQERWEDLIDYYKKNVNPEKVDYYYLRMRLGIAWYEKTNYLKAIPHFRKALSFNGSSMIAKEYLYYAYLYSGQRHMADKIIKRIPLDKRKTMNHNAPAFFESFRFELGVNASNGPNLASKVDLNAEPNIGGEEAFTGNTMYTLVGMEHQFSSNFSIYHAYSSYRISKNHRFMTLDQLTAFDYKINQNNYYLKPTLTLDNGLKLKAAYHHIHVSYDLPSLVSFEENLYEKLWIDLSDYLLYFSAGKYFGKTHIAFNGSYSELNEQQQQQYGAEISWYPYGNYTFVMGVSTAYHMQHTNDTDAPPKSDGLILKPFALWSLTDNFWLKGSYTFGELYNYQEEHGFIVYNIPDKITRKAEITLNHRLNRHLTLNINYRYMKREDDFLSYNSTNVEDYSLTNYNFENHYIIGGITWEF